MYIDNYDFATRRMTLEQNIEVSTLKRALELYEGLKGQLTIKISGDVLDKPILNILIYGKISTLCQICLDPVEIDISHNNIVPIFKNESQLDEALFGDNAEYTDGIVADPEFNVLDFIEDEVIMLLPVAPRHKTCNYVSSMEIHNNSFEVLKKH
jgi:uncharacterized protein